MNTLQLTSFINNYAGKEFVWGKLDCSTFLRDYLREKTGTDYSNLVDFCWETKLQAVRYLKSIDHSYSSMVTAGVRHFAVSGLNQALVGDIVLLNCQGWESAGILFHTGRVACVVEGEGVKLIALCKCDIIRIIRAY